MQLDPHAETAIGHAARKIFAAHHGDPNFTGCGVGFRRRAGKPTDEPAAVAMVVNKRPEAIVSQRRLLPKNVDVDGETWGVDVVEVGALTLSAAMESAAVPALAGPITETFRPPLQGSSISNFNSGATGTLGCLVRDPSDGTICILSTNHVLARLNQATADELIIQPGLADNGTQVMGIGSLKRSVDLTTSANTVDAAIAQLSDQRHISQNVANNLMAPISPTHPAVGMVVADDSASCSRNCFLSRMDTTLSKLNVELLADSGSVVAPQVGMRIEKVGRTSGYTSSMVAATGAIIKVTSQALGQITFSDMIWTQAFHVGGDSGAVACKGGNGRTFAPLPGDCGGGQQGCILIDALATYYKVGLNTADNNSLADTLRDTFLSQSTTGQLIIGTTYLNTQMIIDRLNTQTGPTYNQSVAQARAESLYSKYHDLAARLITSDSPTDVVTQSDLTTVQSILSGLTLPPSYGGTGMTTASEAGAAWALYQNVLLPTLGMNRQRLIDYMNTSAVFQSVHAQLLTVATLQASGTVM